MFLLPSLPAVPTPRAKPPEAPSAAGPVAREAGKNCCTQAGGGFSFINHEIAGVTSFREGYVRGQPRPLGTQDLGAFLPTVTQAARLPGVQPRAVANGLAKPFSWEGRVSPGDLSCLPGHWRKHRSSGGPEEGMEGCLSNAAPLKLSKHAVRSPRLEGKGLVLHHRGEKAFDSAPHSQPCL